MFLATESEPYAYYASWYFSWESWSQQTFIVWFWQISHARISYVLFIQCSLFPKIGKGALLQSCQIFSTSGRVFLNWWNHTLLIGPISTGISRSQGSCSGCPLHPLKVLGIFKPRVSTSHGSCVSETVFPLIGSGGHSLKSFSLL